MRFQHYFLLLLLFSGISNAQERTITGTIKDSQTGIPFPGVTISTKNNSTRTKTDSDGTYSILAQVGDLLSIQSDGFHTETIEVTATTYLLDIEMIDESKNLEEFVVTTHCIKREKLNLKIPSTKQPLYILDGIPVHYENKNLIDNIDPKLIKDVKILKDKKSTVLYGQSGINGCIIITTHEGNYRIN